MNLIETMIYISVLSILMLGSIFCMNSVYFSEIYSNDHSYVLYKQI
jgi:hypothetical protein